MDSVASQSVYDPMLWKPYEGMQMQLLSTKAFECLAGGARGPGKTMAGVVWLIKPYLVRSPQARALVIRKNSDDLADWIDRARYHYAAYGAKVVGKPAVIKFPSGYTIRTGHLKDDNAYTKYQGQEFQRILIEELTQIPNEKLYLQLIASCRSTIPGIDSRVLATTNPGGAGHVWVKNRFVDAGIPCKVFVGKDTGLTRVFYPGKVDDNLQLVKNDPGYIKMLDGLKDVDEELWKAWRNGDWEVFAGRFFREFNRRTHVVRSFTPKVDFKFVAGMDWGRTDPFAFMSSIVVPVRYAGVDKTNPDARVQRDYTFNRVLTFSEVHGTEKMPREWGEIITRKIDISRLEWVQCDNMIFNPQNDGSISIADQFYDYDERFRGKLKMQASVRLDEGKTQRINGWENMHKWLSLAPDGLPYWLITENCVNLIKELPDLQHDDINVEDTMQGTGIMDHASDAMRYKLKAIRWIDAKLGGVNPPAESDRVRQYYADKPIPLNEWSNI